MCGTFGETWEMLRNLINKHFDWLKKKINSLINQINFLELLFLPIAERKREKFMSFSRAWLQNETLAGISTRLTNSIFLAHSCIYISLHIKKIRAILVAQNLCASTDWISWCTDKCTQVHKHPYITISVSRHPNDKKCIHTRIYLST